MRIFDWLIRMCSTVQRVGRSAGAEPSCRDASNSPQYVRSLTVGWLGKQFSLVFNLRQAAPPHPVTNAPEQRAL
jgi:hypothetical protein